MVEKCIAGITTYNPNIERLKKNIEAISRQVDKVIIADNDSCNIKDIMEIVEIFDNVEIIRNDDNYGIAVALNIIGSYAYENNYEWFLTLDQDSVCPSNLIEEYEKNIENDTAIVCPYVDFNESYIKQLLNIKDKDIEEKTVSNSRYVLFAITSGQFIRTKVWNDVNGFWNYLFIDYVDQEFCFNVIRNGYKIVQVRSCELDHEPGIPIKILGIQTAKQSAMREYYCARNSRIVFWLYRKEFMNAIGYIPSWATFKRVANTVLVREDVINKLGAILRGIVDAYKWKLVFYKNGKKQKI